MLHLILAAAALTSASALTPTTGARPAVRASSPAMVVQRERSPTGGLLAASLALALSAAQPTVTHAAVEPPAVVQQYGASLVAESDADLRDAQKKFLEERAKMRTTYDTDVETTYKSAEEVADKKNIYVTIVGGLIAVAFVAPMLQFFYYTGGD